MGGVNSVCESWFEQSAGLHKSSLNAKYVQEKRNTRISSNNAGQSHPDSPFKASTQEDSLIPPQRVHNLSIDDFRIIKVLGRGSYGKIYLVQKKTNNKYYALKVIKKQDLIRTSLRQSILTEKNVLMEASHPFVVRLKYAFQNDTRIYMVMDFCQGGELFLHLKRHGKFDEETLRFYIVEIILALQYLHDKLNIIHRDLKPENILLNADGHIKVTDFGLAKVTNRTYSICGTPEYLAPEVVLKQGYGKSIDCWSLGCLMHEMFTGHPPFSSQDREELNDEIILRNVEMPKDASPALKDLISKLLAKDPNQRLGINGIEEIKQHEFFKDVDWKAYLKKQITPPFIPSIGGNEDVSNFHKMFTNEPGSETPIIRPKLLEDPKFDFPSFSYLDETLSQMPSLSCISKKSSIYEPMEGGSEKILSKIGFQ